MPWGIADAQQLAMMTDVLNAYSVAHQLTDEHRTSAGEMLFVEFNQGARTTHDLAKAMTQYLVQPFPANAQPIGGEDDTVPSRHTRVAADANSTGPKADQ